MKLHGLFAAALAFTVLAGIPANAVPALPSFTALAVADPNRPADQRALDAERKPIEVLNFTGITRGWKVVDLMPGAGYYTRLFSKVVGPKGAVYAIQPVEMDKVAPKNLPILRSFAGTPAYSNVMVLVQPIAQLDIPKGVDMIWTSQNYHDLHDPFMGTPDMARLNKAIYDALKPGGIYIVLDHAAAAGTGTSETNTLHRIDPAAVKAEVTAAGFEFVGESDAERNPADDHTLPIFDKSIKGKTDRFIYKFRKPM
ncbi:class I SAM-dependent methyltransferase [Dyella flava]|uniref:Class I SAM-dependent methyltransferase n=1 Tax=Dyella flava TaxID=1920170 RepID=A0ABS2KA32_9GAMM|nr:class I SAM-dependent methyltransferase [Dyella flava]MBM7127738.1 class I SAM-dependent methyltransferase [Dyella flava]GLQ51339.1 methyltransferase [Dyella flava]